MKEVTEPTRVRSAEKLAYTMAYRLLVLEDGIALLELCHHGLDLVLAPEERPDRLPLVSELLGERRVPRPVEELLDAANGLRAPAGDLLSERERVVKRRVADSGHESDPCRFVGRDHAAGE